MSAMTIHGIDDSLKERLCNQATRHGCSMEEEARDILRAALSTTRLRTGKSMFDGIRAIVAPLGGIELELPPKEDIRTPPELL